VKELRAEVKRLRGALERISKIQVENGKESDYDGKLTDEYQIAKEARTPSAEKRK